MITLLFSYIWRHFFFLFSSFPPYLLPILFFTTPFPFSTSHANTFLASSPSFLQHPFRNLSHCTFQFTLPFSFLSFLFRSLTLHNFPSSLQALGHETHISKMPAVGRLEQLAEEVIYQAAVALGSSKRRRARRVRRWK